MKKVMVIGIALLGGCDSNTSAINSDQQGSSSTASQSVGGIKSETVAFVAQKSGGLKTEFESAEMLKKRLRKFSDEWNANGSAILVRPEPFFFLFDAETQELTYNANGWISPVPATQLGMSKSRSFVASGRDKRDGGILTQRCEITFSISPEVAKSIKNSIGERPYLAVNGSINDDVLLDTDKEYFDALEGTYKPPIVLMTATKFTLMNSDGQIVGTKACN